MVAVNRPRHSAGAVSDLHDIPANPKKIKSRRADSNRPPAPATSDNSCVAGGCPTLQIPYLYGVFSSPACTSLHRIALAVVSVWCQRRPLLFDALGSVPVNFL